MSYFNHAYRKSFLSTKATQAGSPTAKAVESGFLTEGSIHSRYLSSTVAPYTLGVGTFGFFDPASYLSVTTASLPVTSGKPLVLAGSAIFPNDKIGPFHGGYNESNKSKMINPKYIHRFLKQEAQDAEQNVVHIGQTDEFDCDFEVLCGETYNLQINLWGSPVLRVLNHDAYRMLSYNSGCCADVVPTAIDSTLAMIYWAETIINDPYLKNFIRPIVYTEAGDKLYATAAEALAAGALATDLWSLYVSPGHTAGDTAGLILTGAYVETKFGNCSFVKTDFYEKEIVRIKASLVDLGGDPCTFASLCFNELTPGLQAVGFGETVLRDVILDESYLQNHFADDVRIREITQGDAILAAVNRNSLFDRYVILHSVPRFNNPTGVYDNDQYALNIYVPAGATTTAFELFMSTWLTAANVPVELEVFA
jgi:hypothetical protein